MTKDILQKIELLKQEIERIKQELYTKIASLPQNDKIEVISEKPSCFTINVSEVIGRPLSPGYHDFKQQYKLIIKMLIRSEIDTFEKNLATVIKEAKIKDGTQTYPLHPEVIKHLKSII